MSADVCEAGEVVVRCESDLRPQSLICSLPLESP